ncbi:NUDIX domain-containing protein [Actinoplanes sp. GCM10030250]|uniref:NUDIX domain-containing protein n=1 Tax=Actinoplanes sp. GCM10030250 TaxID=3273376 RepID=UPI00360D0E68
MSFRLAAYAVCIERERVLLARYVSPLAGDTQWTLPGGRVEHAEDPFVDVGLALAQTLPRPGTSLRSRSVA